MRYTKEELLRAIAPCSMMCHTCPACQGGAIERCAAQMLRYFEGYYEFNDAMLPAEYRDRLDSFKQFEDRMKKYAKRSCPTCRETPEDGRGCIEDYPVRSCYREKGVDFCAECGEFPCEKAKSFFMNRHPVIAGDWENGSRRLREIGPEAYFEEKKGISHYTSWKKTGEEEK